MRVQIDKFQVTDDIMSESFYDKAIGIFYSSQYKDASVNLIKALDLVSVDNDAFQQNLLDNLLPTLKSIIKGCRGEKAFKLLFLAGHIYSSDRSQGTVEEIILASTKVIPSKVLMIKHARKLNDRQCALVNRVYDHFPDPDEQYVNPIEFSSRVNNKISFLEGLTAAINDGNVEAWCESLLEQVTARGYGGGNYRSIAPPTQPCKTHMRII